MAKEGVVLLSLSLSTAYHNNKDSVTFAFKKRTKTLPCAYTSAWSLVVFYSSGEDHDWYSYRGPQSKDTIAAATVQ